MTEKCGYCGLTHDTLCPMVKSIEYFIDGKVKKVEFKTFPDYGPQLNIPTVVSQSSQQVRSQPVLAIQSSQDPTYTHR